MLELTGIEKSYGAVRALGPLDLSVPPGQTTALIGPSGCGKSTLLRLVLGLISATRGSITLDGVPVTPDNVLGLRLRMGYVLQDGGLFPHLTALGNVTLMPRRLGWTSERIRGRVAELSELTRFPAGALDRYPAQLSGGQRQRVGLMRALVLDPELMLLDEPLGALDPMIRVGLQEELKTIFKRLGKTVVVVTHDLPEAAFFGDEIVVMSHGRIAQRGSFDQLLDAPANDFVARFVRAQRLAHG